MKEEKTSEKSVKTYTEKEVIRFLEIQKEACASRIKGLMTEYTAKKTILETKLVLHVDNKISIKIDGSKLAIKDKNHAISK